MAYHGNLYLLLFLPAVVILYSLLPVRGRRILLLCANAVFYWLFSGKLILYIVGAAVLTYAAGRGMEQARNRAGEEAAGEKTARRWLLLGVIGLLAVLAGLKYTNFTLANLNRLFRAAGAAEPFEIHRILVPLGISFYTLEAVGYLLDVWWKRLPAERNFFRLLLFLSFFPTVMEGPICRFGDVAEPLWECRRPAFSEIQQGTLRILWGLFKKMLVADRLNTVVNTVYSRHTEFSGHVIAGIAILYTIQLYLEFSGAMDMVVGSGMMFGVKLPENFRQPFFAKNASEFWRRWHISLGVWFKNYIFYPVTLSAPVKKQSKALRKKYGRYVSKLAVSMMALLPVWLCNGLWHGPQWNYIFYGLYYFTFLSLEVALEPALEKIHGARIFVRLPKLLAALQIAKTWIIIFVGELFFRAEGFSQGVHMFFSMFRPYVSPFKGSVWLNLGIARSDWAVVLFGTLVVAIADCILEWSQQTGKAFRFSGNASRYAYVYLLFFFVLLLGAYGAGYTAVDLIYAGF